jgi:hypothetical protein
MHLVNFLSVDGFICFWKLKICVALPNRVRSVWALRSNCVMRSYNFASIVFNYRGLRLRHYIPYAKSLTVIINASGSWDLPQMSILKLTGQWVINTKYETFSPSQQRGAPCEGTNSPQLFTPRETKALAKSKVHQWARAWVTVSGGVVRWVVILTDLKNMADFHE